MAVPNLKIRHYTPVFDLVKIDVLIFCFVDKYLKVDKDKKFFVKYQLCPKQDRWFAATVQQVGRTIVCYQATL